MVFAYVAITLCGPAFQRASANHRIGNSTCRGPYNPCRTQHAIKSAWLVGQDGGPFPGPPAPAFGGAGVLSVLRLGCLQGAAGLGCSDFARHYYRNRCCFLFLQVLRWFTSLGSLAPTYGFSGPYCGFTAVGFPIRKSPGQSLLAALRGLSQLATSFFACFCQGIHRAPLVA